MMRHKELLTITKDAVFAAVILAIAAVASIVGLVLAILGFLERDDGPKPEGPSGAPPPIEQLKEDN